MSKKVHSKNELSNSEILQASDLINTIKPKNELELAQEKALELGYKVAELMDQLEKKTQEIQHLKQLLNGVVPNIGEASPLILTDEEIIADMQIQRLKESSMTRELTLDEVKRLDLLIKNKRLVRGDATEIPGKAKSIKDKPVEKLLQIAKKSLSEV